MSYPNPDVNDPRDVDPNVVGGIPNDIRTPIGMDNLLESPIPITKNYTLTRDPMELRGDIFPQPETTTFDSQSSMPLQGMPAPETSSGPGTNWEGLFLALEGFGAGIQGREPLMVRLQKQRQAQALQVAQLEETKRQHDLGLLERVMQNPRASVMLEQLGQDSKYSLAPQAKMLGKALKDTDYASFKAYQQFIPQEVQERFLAGALPYEELTGWLDEARTSFKENARAEAKATSLKNALNKQKSGQPVSAYEQKLIDDSLGEMELRNAKVDELKASAELKRKQVETGGVKFTQMAEEIASELYDKPFGALTQAERGVVERVKEKRLHERTGAIIQQGLPAEAEKRSNLIDRKAFLESDQLKQPPPGITKGDMARGDYVEMTDKQREEWSSIVNSGVTLQSLFDLVDPLITATTPAQAAKQYARLSVGAVSKKNPQAATYQTDSEAFSSRMARVFGSEVGVLTQGDVNRWQRALPTFGDTKQVAQEKKKIFMGIFNQTKNMYKKKIAGEDITGDLERLRSGLLKRAEDVAPPSIDEDLKALGIP